MTETFFEWACARLSQNIDPSFHLKVPEGSYKSYTTIGAFKIAGGAAIAFADGQVSEMGGRKIADDYNKIIQITDEAVLLISGVPKMAKDVAKILKMTAENHLKLNDRKITVRAIVNLTENLILKNFSLVSAGLVFIPILVAYDDSKKETRIFSFSPEGSSIAQAKYVMGGSGSSAWAKMESAWKENLTEEEGIKLANEYLDITYAHDGYSGGKRNICVVCKDGIRYVGGK